MNAGPSKVIERLLAGRIGLDPSTVGEALIARGVHARMAALGLHSVADYEWTLLDRADELQALVEEVVVPESWFFRDDRPFEALADLARSGWLADPGRPPLAALSIPCAGGEEPYSIAMTLLEAGLPAGRFRVDAVDVSARSLARAIAGVYGRNAFRGTPSARRSGYFLERNGAFTLDPSVRSTVRFHLGNLLDPALFADRPPFDVVFCRNVLIYLDDESRALAFATLGRLVADGGLLFLGHADRLDDPGATPFEAMVDKGSFAYRKGKGGARPARSSPKAPTSKAPPSYSPPERAGVRGAASPPAPGSGPIGRHPTGGAPHPGPLPKGEGGRKGERAPAESTATILDRASGLADLGRYDEAKGLVDRAIAEGGSGGRAYFLLGLIAQASRALDRAEAHYLKAIYLDPQHDEALLALALLARRKGDVAGEATYRRRAGRVLARKFVP